MKKERVKLLSISLILIFIICGCWEQHDYITVTNKGDVKFISNIEIKDIAKEFGFADIEEFSSGFLSDLKNAGWTVEKRWISKKRPYKLEFNGSGNLDKVATKTDFYKMTKVSDLEYRIRFIPAESKGQKSSRAVTFKKRILRNSAYFYDSNGEPVETISNVQTDKQYVIALDKTVQNKLIKQAKERGSLSDDERAKKSIENYISSYLDENLKTLIGYDSNMYESIIQKVRKVPKQFQDEEFEKYLSEKINQLKKYEQNKRIKGTIFDNKNTKAFFLQRGFGGGASPYDILYPEIKYEVMEIRDSSESETIDCEQCDKMAFVRLYYQNLQNAPYLDIKKTTKIKSAIIKIYLSKWSNENTGWVGYKLLHFQPTSYKIELFDRHNSKAIREREDREKLVKEQQQKVEKAQKEEQEKVEREARKKQKDEYERKLAERKKREKEAEAHRKIEAEKRKQEEARIAALRKESEVPAKTLFKFKSEIDSIGSLGYYPTGEITDTNITLADNSRNKTRTIWFGNFDSIEKQFVRLLGGAWQLRINRVYRMISKDEAEIDKIYDVLTLAISQWYDKFSDVAPRKTRPVFLSKSSKVTGQKTNQLPKRNEISLVINIQQELNMLGYYNGKIDGLYGPKTASSIKSYQRDNNLTPDGKPSSELLAHLESKKKTSDEPEQAAKSKKTKEPITLEATINKAVDDIFKVIFKK